MVSQITPPEWRGAYQGYFLKNLSENQTNLPMHPVFGSGLANQFAASIIVPFPIYTRTTFSLYVLGQHSRSIVRLQWNVILEQGVDKTEN